MGPVPWSRLRRWLVVMFGAAATLGPTAAVYAAPQKQVLALYYSGYIDSVRFPDPCYQAAFNDFLRLKYKGQRSSTSSSQSAALRFSSSGIRQVFVVSGSDATGVAYRCAGQGTAARV
jgi:hypothetical protein